MGPQSCLEIFRQLFEEAPDSHKYHVAPMLNVLFSDVLAKLECSTDTCQDLQDRKDAASYILNYIKDWLGGGGGGGGS